jgi:hypothetical protein
VGTCNAATIEVQASGAPAVSMLSLAISIQRIEYIRYYMVGTNRECFCGVIARRKQSDGPDTFVVSKGAFSDQAFEA